MSEIEFTSPDGSKIYGKKGNISKDVKIGKGSKVEGKTIEIGDGVRIGENVSIRAKNVKLGYGCKIGNDVRCDFRVIPDKIEIGDFTEVAEGVKIRIPSLHIGDYGRIHSEVVFYGVKKCIIGHNCWIGQWSILNSAENLVIGNNFRLGVQSQIWTHVASGEIIEGCKIYNVESTHIEDDVWLVGHSIVSPGIRIKKRTTVLPGAILSKDTIEGHCYAGVPAKDITDKYNPYKDITLDEKYDIMKKLVKDFVSKKPEYVNKVILCQNPNEIPSDFPTNGVIFIFKDAADNFILKDNSVFDIKTKRYQKMRSRIEIEFIKANIGHNARFVPYEG